MTFLIQKKLEPFYFGFLWVILLSLIFSSFFFFFHLFDSRNNSSRLEEKKQWDLSLKEYASSLKDAETGVRGYLLSKDRTFLNPYHKALILLPNIEQYLIDHCENEDKADLISLINLSHSKLKHIESHLLSFPQRNPSNQSLVIGNQKMAEFRYLYDSLTSRKQKRDQFEIEKHNKSSDRLLVVSAGLFLLLSFLILWMIFILKKSIKSISEKEMIEDRYFEIEDLYQNSPVGFHSLDPDGFFLRVNRTESEWFGYSEKELIGKKKWSDLLTENSRNIFFQNFPIFKKQGYINNLIFEVIKKNGDSIFVNLSSTAIFAQNGLMIRSRSVLVDVTQSIVYERELLLAKKKAEEANKAKSDFLSNMSHELRTPLNAVIGISLWLLEENPKTEQLENLKNLKFSSESLLSLINDILDFNKIEERLVEIERIDFNLKDFLKSITTSFTMRAKEKLLFFNEDIKDTVPEFIHSDPTRLLQILNNLLSNALKFTQVGSITLSVSAIPMDSESELLTFEVTDTGIGIEPNKFQSVFEKFTQANQDTTRKFGGSGLGLAISKALVELMGGHLVLTSEVGKGSKFSFSLPCKIGKANEFISISTAKNNDALKDKIVLVADDIQINRSIVIRFLNRWGIQTFEATNGLEVLEILKKQHVDLILMDLHMPEMDGYMSATEIRKVSNWNQIPILALTASAQLETRAQIKSVGMNDYISKPFNPNDLLNQLHFWIGS
ncbi:response regulator [Leptospira biflexa]|uniref:ATP-binding protein n=1 Tax=Leptospira biflexa TaxID=172 RepID=UPI0010910E6C|nr:ATP-binding protein [Leptospira biflexa]TGM57522.1 response regulator [Leptospira biflexa]